MLLVLTACAGSEETDPAESDATVTAAAVYSGILTKVRLGMTESKIISMIPDSSPLNYQDDYELWTVDSDTNMQKIRDYLPEGDLNYYADDSLITFFLKDKNGSPEKILSGYMEEVYGVFSQDASVKFYNDTIARLEEEFGVTPTGTMSGEQGIDEELTLKQVYDCPSATVTFICTYKWQTVNEKDDYYGSSFSVKLMGKTIKDEVALETGVFTPAVTATGSDTSKADETTAPAENETESETEPAE
jgi:hypothetical protein